MSDRFDICVPRPGKDDKTRWVKIGAAFPSRSGEGFNCVLDALPLTDSEGRCAFSLFPPREDNGNQRQQRGNGGRQQQRRDDALDDEIPF